MKRNVKLANWVIGYEKKITPNSNLTMMSTV